MEYTVEKEDLELIIESKQNEVRQNVVDQYIKCRKEQKMTQEDVANALGVKRPNITRFEKGNYNPTIDMLVKIAEIMGKDVQIQLVDRQKA